MSLLSGYVFSADEDFQVNTYTVEDQRDGSVTALKDGGFAVVWSSSNQDGDGNGIYVQIYDAVGHSVGTEFEASQAAGSVAYPNVMALADGGFFVSWTDFGRDGDLGGIYGQRFDALGAKIGDDLLINTTTASTQYAPKTTLLADGSFVVCWNNQVYNTLTATDVFAQHFNANGEKLGGQFQANTFTDGVQSLGSIAALADGGFIITWQSANQDGEKGGIFAQRFDANGNKVDIHGVTQTGNTESGVNAVMFGDQSVPSVTGLKDGGFVVAWQSDVGTDGSNYGIYGRLYDHNGDAVVSDFLINTTTENNQMNPGVKDLPDGGFLVTWQSNAGGALGVFAQRFDLHGVKVGGEFEIDNGHYSVYSPQIAAQPDGNLFVAWTSSMQDGSAAGIYGRLLTAAIPAMPGDAAANDIAGTDDSDFIDGGRRADKMTGMKGDDFYVVDNLGDQPIELAGEGNDTIISAITFSLANFANVENIELTGNAALNATGNGADNRLTGNSAANILSGAAGNDILNGGAGKDRLIGGVGNDVYVVDNVGDRVIETLNAAKGGGTDTVRSTIGFSLAKLANVENIQLLGTGNIGAIGNKLGNLLVGNGGNNRLDGGAGADILKGGAGNDTYVLDNIGDSVVESYNGGIDTIILKAGALDKGAIVLDMNDARWANVEGIILADKTVHDVIGTAEGDFITGNGLANILYGGDNADTLDGGKGSDTLLGGDGEDTLIGGKGADIMLGGAGDDIYYVDSSKDRVVESDDASMDSGGYDTVYSTISLDLSVYALGRIEAATLQGKASLSLIGNAADNLLTGNAGKNVLNGAAGDDTLIGGLGKDTLTGGLGGDDFVYNNLKEKGDIITDFSKAQGDVIEISALLTNSTDYENGAGGLLGNYVRIITDNHGGSLLQIDADGAGNHSGWVTLATLKNVTDLRIDDLIS